MKFSAYATCLALISFTELALAANNATWNCEQGKNGEWTCLNPSQSPQAQAQTPPPQPQTRSQQPQPGTATTPAPATAQAPASPATQPVKPTTTPPTPQATPQVAEVPEGGRSADRQKIRVRMAENQQPVVEKITAPAAMPQAAVKNTGWTCKAGDEKTQWNCNLVGPDPKGEAQIMADSVPSTFWLTPTFNHRQERVFEVLRSEFDHDPWQSCSNWASRKPRPQMTPKEVRDDATTNVYADFSEMFDGEIMSFAGNVNLRRADQHLLADKASYDTVADTLDAQGNVIYSENQLAISAESVSLSLGRDEARLRSAQFILPAAPMRGTADTVYRDSKTLSRYHDATFTSCPPGNQDWIMHASRIKINRESGQGSAKGAWMEFKGVPVFYTPYISFPVDNRRLSGFLTPTWGNTQRNGLELALPFYWNIAPNFDTTITARYMAQRGGMLRNRFRYLTETSQGAFNAELLPYDQLRNDSRYAASFRDISTFSEHLHTNTNLNYVSDKEYFNDLNNALGFQTDRFLPSTAFMNYNRPNMLFSAGMHYFQSVDKTIDDASMPYALLPRVALNLGHEFDNMPLAVALDNQFSHFQHTTLVNGQRINIAPSISMPLEATAGFVIPKLTGHYTQYQLSNHLVAGQPDSISRFLPIFSVDSGVTLERETSVGGSPYIHSLEPRAFYLYIPRKDQSHIPVFDTAAFDTNYFSLFRPNVFSGMDRITDANQITLAASSSLRNAATGLEPLRVSLGQIVYFQDRTVDLFDRNNPRSIDTPNHTSKVSHFISEFSGQLTRHLSYQAGAQWDPEHDAINRGMAVLKFRNQPNQIFDIGYRFRDSTPLDSPTALSTSISQTDVSFRWPLLAGWYGLGRWQYSLNFSKTTESFIGLERETCCWRLRVIGRRFINGALNPNFFAPDAQPETAFFVQLELKGLTGFGDKVDQFLQRNLNGYRPATDFDDH
ncbi:MAG: LPS biosynthesis protein [Methylomonas sp.]|nr:MAG: LPS biosynthesis protein [Methylomonas sp.]PPD27114.1 MAG: LPS biosynthesis protein [Methylomonas sp.]PPD39068.1 MAG: LPS biosynthesis protein [Methylomonas sp.]PPD42296.1 MAG: LPS biosynthesis protein [Methylomonas sp.]PPD54984.1 MAG: LPS biosynthesis protein [Methylomonas sp.]